MEFYKYHGAGNDFIILDGMERDYNLRPEHVQLLCDRNLGIGSDGLVVIMKSDIGDFKMQFFNPDGTSGMMCGNGARCAIMLAADRGYVGDEMRFETSDGVHHGILQDDFLVSLTIPPVNKIDNIDGNYFLNTGTFHLVVMLKEGLENYDVYSHGKRLREDEKFAPTGTNVNFLQKTDVDEYSIRTYEKGVENETLACGTGIVAAALVAHKVEDAGVGNFNYDISASISRLSVSFHAEENGIYRDIWLTGPVKKVFTGVLEEDFWLKV